MVIDGYLDDWEPYTTAQSDQAGDQLPGSADLAGLKAFTNDRYLYGMVSFHELGYFNHIIFGMQLDDGSNAQLNVFLNGMAQFASGGSRLNPVEVRSAYQQVLEFRVPLEVFDAIPVQFQQVDTYLPEDDQRGDTMQGGEIGRVAELEPIDGEPAPPSERPVHYSLAYPDMVGGYLYRTFIQTPVGIEIGPDDHLYVADWNGGHIVRLSPDGTAEDLGLWRDPALFGSRRPLDIAFDDQGRLYFADGGAIYRMGAEGVAEKLEGVSGRPESIAFGPDGALYYADLNGSVVRLEIGQQAQTLAQLQVPRGIAVGDDGMVYVTRWSAGDIVRIDPSTGELVEFQPGACNFDPCFLAIDPEGDIWVRGIFVLRQFAPDGSEKPYTLIADGRTMPGNQYGWHTSAGIAFDSQGNLWIASYNSWVQFMSLTIPDEGGAPVFELLPGSQGFEASDLDVGPEGMIYATDVNGRQLLGIDPDGGAAPLVEHGSASRDAVAVDQQGVIYYTAFGEVFRLEPGGDPDHFSSITTERMIVGGDGYLYAASQAQDGTRSIVRITGVDQVETVATEFNAEPFEQHELYLMRGPGNDLLVYVRATGNVYRMSPEGSASLVGFVGFASPAAASPTSGTVYFMAGYTLKSLDLEGNVRILGEGIDGDPWGMAVSPDGRYLYIAESGAVDRIIVGE